MSNYPPGMNRSDLRHVGELPYCDECDCDDFDLPRVYVDPKTREDCAHDIADVNCECGSCECDCHSMGDWDYS